MLNPRSRTNHVMKFKKVIGIAMLYKEVLHDLLCIFMKMNGFNIHTRMSTLNLFQNAGNDTIF